MESSLCISYAKIATDGAQLDSFMTLLKGVSFDELDVALDSLAKVGPGGHFFDEDYTRTHLPFTDHIQDNERFETWVAAGAKDATARGTEWIRRALERYEAEPPGLDPASAEALADYVARREREIPAGIA